MYLAFTPATLDEEKATTCLQILIYLFPLASFEVIVDDLLWFMRENCLFLDYLRQAGYWRFDPFDPAENDLHFNKDTCH